MIRLALPIHLDRIHVANGTYFLDGAFCADKDYCLIPFTKVQKMLMLIGKSRIGLVLRALLGGNVNTGSIAKVETSPFARANLEHELVMVDDDMKLEVLLQINHIKAIVTAELPMNLEEKGQQSYHGDLYVRFLAFGNGTLQSLYDRSVGFFCRPKMSVWF